MTIRLKDLIQGLDDPDSSLRAASAAALGLPESSITHLQLLRRSIDSRGRAVRFVNTVDVALQSAEAESEAVAKGLAAPAEELAPVPVNSGSAPVAGRIIVVGTGPAGLFGALLLAEQGYKPLVLERGASPEERHVVTQRFLSDRRLDPESNYLFGAGGAGAYSDGKLHTRIRDPRIRNVLDKIIACGGPPELAVEGRPHVGTDRLRGVVSLLCRDIQRLGGEILWRTRLSGIAASNGKVVAVQTSSGAFDTNCVLVASGANAPDSFQMLLDAGVQLAGKPFQMGLRIEHPREMIDRAVYGRYAGHPRLGAADYSLSSGGVTTFCVCPGGEIVPAIGETGCVCTNGMSRRDRNNAFTNAALVATVSPDQFANDPLKGLEFQRQWERQAFSAVGSDYSAPAQSADDFLKGAFRAREVKSSYPLGVRPARLERIIPSWIASAIAAALKTFDSRMKGYAGDAAILVGPETRASCPVRILRDPTSMSAQSVDGIYPAGEGSGYASGIMSSAVDGMRAADAIISRFAPPA